MDRKYIIIITLMGLALTGVSYQLYQTNLEYGFAMDTLDHFMSEYAKPIKISAKYEQYT